jgi:hypothetical protein
MESFCDDINDDLVMQLTIVGCGNVPKVFEPLEIVMVSHVTLSKVRLMELVEWER